VQPSSVAPLNLFPRLLFAVALATVAVTAQQGRPVGTRSVAWPNPTAAGSPALAATVRYPAATPGVGVPMLTHPTGWPVVVLLHGFGLIGQDYGVFADALVRAGFVVVLPDTCQWDWDCQEADGRAMFPALANEDADASSPFYSALDMHRVALVGHSMGGSSVGNILASNPGYRCGFTLAPVWAFGSNSSAIMVPFGIVVGSGDLVTSYASYALPYYTAVTNHGSVKLLYQLDTNCDHFNVAGLEPAPWSTVTTSVFDRTVKVTRGFLQHCMGISPMGFETTIGLEALAEPMLVSLQQETVVPQVWMQKAFQIGQTTRVSVATHGSLAVLMGAGNVMPGVPTPFGPLAIDLGSLFVMGVAVTSTRQRADIQVTMPADPLLIGVPIALQALAETPGTPTLSNAWLTNIR
jgi:pimeloyl-ACP methyl ester carboxylesterase